MRPNFLFVVSDQHRGDWTDWSGASFVRTPNLSRLAEAGTVFADAICPAPLCAPSRICMARGQNYGRATSDCKNGVALDNDGLLPMDEENLYARLQQSGYAVAACGKSDLRKEDQSWGRDGQHMSGGRSVWNALGFTHGLDSAGKHDGIWAAEAGIPEPYLSFLADHGLDKVHLDDFAGRPFPNYRNTDPTKLPDFAYGDNYVAASAEAIMREFAGGEKPWFLQVNFRGPHEPMDITESMKDGQNGRTYPPLRNGADITEEKYHKIARNYVAMIENIDARVGAFLDLLEETGQLENTVIIYTSDHGEMLGENGKWGKLVPYSPSVGVPMVFYGPGVGTGTVNQPVSLIDLAPTLLEIAGANQLSKGDGVSLAPYLRGEGTSGDDTVRVSGMGPWRSIQDEDYKLIVGYVPTITNPEIRAGRWDGQLTAPMLFDRRNDPHEEHNIADANPAIVEKLFGRLVQEFTA